MGGGIRNPLDDMGDIGSAVKALSPAAALASGTLPGLAGVALGQNKDGLDIKDPAGMNQYTELANQAQQQYGKQNEYMAQNVDPKRTALLEAYQAQANGTAPSIAQAQMKAAYDKSLQQQLALAKSSRGASPGLSARNVMNNANQQQLGIAQNSGIAAMNERRQGQQDLGNMIANEQNYATSTLGSALGSQANVANMQNAQRDRNDSRKSNIFNQAAQMFGLGMATGGQVPQFQPIQIPDMGVKPRNVQFKSKGGTVQFLAKGGSVKSSDQMSKAAKICRKYASGGQVSAESANVGEIAQPDKDEKGSGPDMDMLMKLAPLLLNSGGSVSAKPANVGSTDNFVKAASAQNFKPVKFGKGLGSSSKPTALEAPKAESTDNNSFHDSTQPSNEFMMASDGGNVPGQAQVNGDSLQNDRVPTMLSPGEVVVPRSVIADGPIASAHFVKNASSDQSYNADTYAKERKSFAQMLQELQQNEDEYKKVKSIIKRK